MLNKILKLVIVAPVLMAGVFISANAEEKQVKPNIHNLTGEQSSKKVSSDIPDSQEGRIPGDIHKSSLGIGVGQTFLRSDLGNNGNDKITADVYYNYSASYSFDFLANLHYSTHQYINRSSKISGLALAIKGKGFQYDAFSPFVLGGFGFYMPGATRLVDGVLSTAREQLVFGFNAGVGADLRLNSNASIGVIAHYHDPFDVRQEVGPALQGSYLKLLMTAMYTFN
jgi:hypothetical protein